MPISKLLATPAALPSISQVVSELIASFDREDVTLADIARQLASDPVISAKTLRLANSAYFHVSRQIATVDDALAMLGLAMVRNLVLGQGLSTAFKNVHGLDLAQFWRHSLYTASTARWLAMHGQTNADLAFTVGLVHGLGQLVMHSVLGAELAALNERCHPLAAERAQAERDLLGYDHAQVSAELARQWKFPAAIADPLALVPQPDAQLSPVAALVHLGAWRARAELLPAPPEALAASFPQDVAQALALALQWDAEQATLVMTEHGEAVPMPPMAELCGGLALMLD